MGTRIAEIDGFRGTHELLVSRIWVGRVGASAQFTIGDEFCTIDKYQAIELARKILDKFGDSEGISD